MASYDFPATGTGTAVDPGEFAGFTSGSYLRGAADGNIEQRTVGQVLSDIAAAAATHTHAASDLASGQVALARGGTNADLSATGGTGQVLIQASAGAAVTVGLVPTHASRHQSGGADAIKLDDLAAPEDNTDLNVSASAHGLCPKYPNNTTTFLRGDGTYAAPAAGVDVSGTPVAGQLAAWTDADTLQGVAPVLALNHYSASTAYSTGLRILTTIPSSATGSYRIECYLKFDGGADIIIHCVVNFKIAGAAITTLAGHSGPGSYAPPTYCSLVGGFVQISFGATTTANPIHAWATCQSNVTTASYFSGWTLTDAQGGSAVPFENRFRGAISHTTGTATFCSDGSAATFAGTLGVTGNLTSSGVFLPVVKCVAAYPTSNQGSLAADTYNKILFGTERLDTEAAFASSTFTAPRTGKYRICLNAYIATTSVSDPRGVVVLYVNGARVTTTARGITMDPVNNYPSGFSAEWTLALTAADTVDIYVQHEDGTGTIYAVEGVSGNSDTGSTELLIEWMGT